MKKLSQSEISTFFKEWGKKIEECTRDGHKEPHNLDVTISSRNNPLLDKGLGYCSYCETHYERPLTSEEISEIYWFERAINMPFNL